MELEWYVAVPIVGLVIALIYWKMSSSSSPPSKPPTTPSPPTKQQVKQKKEAPEEDSAGLIKVRIFYGSQTGTAEDFAHKLASEAKRFKFFPKVTDLEGYDTGDLAGEGFVVFLVATYGEGEPTDNAREFYEWITDESLDPETLKGLKFTVFGLGNKTYEHYNAIGRVFDKRLEELGAQRIFKRGEGDDDASLEDDYASWKKELWPALAKEFDIKVDLAESGGGNERRYRVHHYPDESHEAKTAKANIHKHLCKKEVRTVDYDLKNPYLAQVVENRELHAPESDRSCRHIEIDIGKELKYEPGDHLGVYPENNPDVVEHVGRRLKQDLDVVFSLLPIDSNDTSKPFLGPCTYRQAFLQWTDLTSPPRKAVLKVFAELATEPKEKKRLQLLSDEEKAQPYTKYIKDDFRSVLEILEEFPSVNITADHLIEIATRLAPRYYSISSSLKLHPGKVHATSVVVDFQTPSGRKHAGVCSNWLARQIPTETVKPPVYVFIEKAKFKLPKDHATPVIMVGPGTGIAPFRGFIQERHHLLQSGIKTENLLFFGCRSHNLDFLYKDELVEVEKKGLLRVSVAFSRDQEHKVYVQHKMKEEKDLIWDLLHNKKGCFYICGDARVMAKDVNQTLKDIIVEKLQVTEEQANDYIANLQKESRYHTDIWF